MSRSFTAAFATFLLAISFVLGGCDTGEPEPDDQPAQVRTVDATDDGTIAVDTDGDDGFESATASVEVAGDVEGSLSLASLRSADVTDGIFTATIASAEPEAVLEIAAPAENETATTGAGDVRLRLDVADPDSGEVLTFEAGEGTCTITMAPAEVSVNGTFECSGMTSDTGDRTIDASGSFAVNRG